MRQLFEVFKQPFLIFGDAQIPLLKLFLLNRAVASPAAAINNFLVRQCGWRMTGTSLRWMPFYKSSPFSNILRNIH